MWVTAFVLPETGWITPDAAQTLVIWCLVLAGLVLFVSNPFKPLSSSLNTIPKGKIEKAQTTRRKNKSIDEILVIIEKMDNRLYELLPVVKGKSIPIEQENKAFGLGNMLLILFSGMFFGYKAIDYISTLMDENGMGVKEIVNDKQYLALRADLESKMRLKSVPFRNAVHRHLNYWHDVYNCILFFTKIKNEVDYT